MNLSSSVMYGMGISLGGLEIATDYIYGNSDIYEPELSEVKAVISNKPMKNKMPNRNVKPKISIEGIMDKFRLVKNEENSVITGEEIIIGDGVMVRTEDGFDFGFDETSENDDTNMSIPNNVDENILDDIDIEDSAELIDSVDESVTEGTEQEACMSSDSTDNEDEEETEFGELSELYGDEDEPEDIGEEAFGDEEAFEGNGSIPERVEEVAKQISDNVVEDEEQDDLSDELFGKSDDEEWDDTNSDDSIDELFGDSVGEDEDSEEQDNSSVNIVTETETVDEEQETIGNELDDDTNADFDESDLFGEEDEEEDEDYEQCEQDSMQALFNGDAIVQEQPITKEPAPKKIEVTQKAVVTKETRTVVSKNTTQNKDTSIENKRPMKPNVSNNSSGTNRVINGGKGVTESVHASRQGAQVETTDGKTESYDEMTIESLYSHVKKFLVQSGVGKKLIEVSVLNSKFGEANIKRLIKKSYLILIGKGVTIGR